MSQSANCSNHEEDDSQSRPVLQRSASADSQARNSLSQSQDTSRTFRKYPCLLEAFEHEYWDDNHQRLASCRSCGIKYRGNRHKRLFEHVKECSLTEEAVKKKLAAQSSFIFNEKHKDLTNLRRNLKLTAYIVETGSQFSISERKTFKSFVHDLDPRYRPASRHDISSELLPLVSLQVEQKFLRIVDTMHDFSYMVEFDHWADLCHKEFLGVIATRPDGKRFLFDLKDVSSIGKSAKATIPLIQGILGKLPPLKINAIISDSAAPCKKARSILSMDFNYCHLFEYGCLAHLMHNCGKKMGQFEPMKSLLATASSITSYLSLDPLFLAKLKDQGFTRIKKASKTRWSSEVEMLESLELVKHVMIDHLEAEKKNRRNKERIQSDLDTINEASFWDDLRHSISVYRPIANSIALIERADGCLSEAVRSILTCAASLLTHDAPDRFTKIAIYAFFSYFNEDKLGEFQYGLMLAAYFLDRRYKMDFITDTGIELVLRTLGQIASMSSLSGSSSRATEEALYSGFSQYCKQLGSLSRPAPADMKPSVWWLDQPDDLGILKIVGVRLGCLHSSSANLERVFSILRFTQSLNRTNYNLETLTSLTRTKLWLLESGSLNSMEDLFDEQSLEEPSNPLLSKIRAPERDLPAEIELSAEMNILDLQQDLPDDVQQHIRRFRALVDFSRITRFREDRLIQQNDGDMSDRLIMRLRADRGISRITPDMNNSNEDTCNENIEPNARAVTTASNHEITCSSVESDSLIDSIIEAEMPSTPTNSSNPANSKNSRKSSLSLNSSRSRQSTQSLDSSLSRQSSQTMECPAPTESPRASRPENILEREPAESAE